MVMVPFAVCSIKFLINMRALLGAACRHETSGRLNELILFGVHFLNRGCTDGGDEMCKFVITYGLVG